MMKKLIAIFILLLTLNTILKAQNKYFRDLNEQNIGEEQFYEKIKSNSLGWGYVKIDTAVIVEISQKFREAKLPLSVVKQIRNSLEDYSKQQIDSSSLLIISYFSGIEHLECKCLLNDSLFIKKTQLELAYKINKIKGSKLFTLLDKKFNQNVKYQGLINPYRDENNILGHFFKLQYPLASYLIIRSDGKYLAVFGTIPNTIDLYRAVKQLSKRKFKNFEEI